MAGKLFTTAYGWKGVPPAALFAALIAAAIVLGCPSSIDGAGDVGPIDPRAMVSMPEITVTGAGDDGAFPGGRTVTLSAYKIAVYQTTYGLWHEVKTWADSQGYSFANPGCEGTYGEDGAEPTAAAKTDPVTYINWWDALVWCNAYSEMEGKTPVYYTDRACSEALRTSGNGGAASGAAGSWLRPYVKAGADGYRLPTEAEWEAAARGGDPLDTARWGRVYAGSDTPDRVAWYGGNAGIGAHPVGRKAANSAGLYDMSGNVWEWCFDSYNGSLGTGTERNPLGADWGPHRIVRGGSWHGGDIYCAVTAQGLSLPFNLGLNFGFRVAATVL